jgi:ABC-type uncharacterized transport system fused permease/ATPase subunit
MARWSPARQWVQIRLPESHETLKGLGNAEFPVVELVREQVTQQNDGPLPLATRRRLLLHGGNGIGKTTILEAVRTLWELFGEWIDPGS